MCLRSGGHPHPGGGCRFPHFLWRPQEVTRLAWQGWAGPHLLRGPHSWLWVVGLSPGQRTKAEAQSRQGGGQNPRQGLRRTCPPSRAPSAHCVRAFGGPLLPVPGQLPCPSQSHSCGLLSHEVWSGSAAWPKVTPGPLSLRLTQGLQGRTVWDGRSFGGLVYGGVSGHAGASLPSEVPGLCLPCGHYRARARPGRSCDLGGQRRPGRGSRCWA